MCASGLRTSAVNAALANGMFAHADETDDFEPVTKAHPGSAVVPAALAVAERDDRSGAERPARRGRSATTCAAASCSRSAPTPCAARTGAPKA